MYIGMYVTENFQVGFKQIKKGGLQDMVAPPLEQLIPKSCRFSTVMPENTVDKRLTLSYVC